MENNLKNVAQNLLLSKTEIERLTKINKDLVSEIDEWKKKAVNSH